MGDSKSPIIQQVYNPTSIFSYIKMQSHLRQFSAQYYANI